MKYSAVETSNEAGISFKLKRKNAPKVFRSIGIGIIVRINLFEGEYFSQ